MLFKSAQTIETWKHRTSELLGFLINLSTETSNLIVINVSTNQKPKEIWECTLYRNMEHKGTQKSSLKVQKINLRIHKELKHVDIKSNCDQCENKATQKCHLSVHKQSKHEGIMMDCDQCEHKAKHRGSLGLPKQ